MASIELPFLYQTRTILRCSTRAKALRSTRSKPRAQRLLSTTASTRTEEPSESFLSQKAREIANSASRKSKPSITRTEKQIFDDIFHDIKTSSGRPANTKEAAHETDPNALLRLFLQESGQRHVSNTEVAIELKNHEHPSTDLRDYINRYPSSLRHVARRATLQQPASVDTSDQLPYKSFQPSEQDAQVILVDRGISKDPRHGVYRPLGATKEAEAEGSLILTEGLQLRNFDAIKEDEIARGTFRGKTADYVEKELNNISTELESCTTPKSQSSAFKMWDICQQKILPIVSLLDKQPELPTRNKTTGKDNAAVTGLTDSGSGKKTTKKTSKRKAAKQEPMTNEPPLLSLPQSSPMPHAASAIPSGVSSLSVVTTLYPTLTLLALRLFTTHFPTMPFPLTLYTIIKSTSPQSRILGLNVHFYNTLLQHIWHIYSDLHRITSTLSEMQSSGVDFDGNTYILIRNIEEERWNQFHADEGSRGRDWWERPEQVRRYKTLMEWKVVVATKLQEQGMGHLLAEREYSSELLGESEVDSRPKVWL